MRITTTYKTTADGKGQIVAKGEGRQRTVSYDHSLSVKGNHGAAAGTLALVLIEGATARALAADTAKVVKRENGKTVFALGE